VIPNEHVTSVTTATDEQVAEVARLVRRVSLALDSRLDPTGINVFQNNGVPSGQTVPHYHVHVVPRYPHSERGRLFREQDFDITPLPELEELAELIRGPVGEIGGSAP
jgi:histidine triad (HIT) family protein